MPYGSPSLTASIAELLTRLNTMIGVLNETKGMLDKAMTYLGRVVVDEVEKIKEAENERQRIRNTRLLGTAVSVYLCPWRQTTYVGRTFCGRLSARIS